MTLKNKRAFYDSKEAQMCHCMPRSAIKHKSRVRVTKLLVGTLIILGLICLIAFTIRELQASPVKFVKNTITTVKKLEERLTPVKFIIYEKGCFDAKRGNSYILRCG